MDGRTTSSWTLLLVALLLGCDETPESPPSEKAEPPVAETVGAQIPVVARGPVDASAETDPLLGTWWARSPELPTTGFRINLFPGAETGTYAGSWITFDGLGSTDAASLSRPSRPVAIQGHRSTEPSQGGVQLTLTGPMPELDGDGQPNGWRGTWEMRLRQSSLPGEPLRLSGRIVSPTLTRPEGESIELTRTLSIAG